MNAKARERARELIANKCPHWAHTVNQIMRSHCEECLAAALIEFRKEGLEEAAKICTTVYERGAEKDDAGRQRADSWSNGALACAQAIRRLEE
mgnify:CR=1 FL=1